MEDLLKNDWKEVLKEEMDKAYFKNLEDFLKIEYEKETIYPEREDIFNALNYTCYKDVKVVILGQDPYHGRGQAYGFSFSVKPTVKVPPSLRNIYKELNQDLGLPIPNHGDLSKWAREGVLLLNTVLTVREKSPNSHKGRGWEKFTDRIIEILNEREDPIVFILWGKNAQEKEALITNSSHHVIKSFHPSPFSANRGFFGSRPFSRTNEFLRSINKEEIDWKLDNI